MIGDIYAWIIGEQSREGSSRTFRVRVAHLIIVIMIAIRQRVAVLQKEDEGTEIEEHSTVEETGKSIYENQNRCDAHEDSYNLHPSIPSTICFCRGSCLCGWHFSTNRLPDTIVSARDDFAYIVHTRYTPAW